MLLANRAYHRTTPQGIVSGREMSASTKLTLLAAERYGIACREILDTGIIELTYRGRKTFMQAQHPFSTSCIALYATENKTAMKSFLKEAGINTPKGFTLLKRDDEEYFKKVFDTLQKPMVVKPTHGSKGDGVHTSIYDYQKYLSAVKDVLPIHPSEKAGCIVEEMFDGEEFRVLVTRNKVVGVLNRVPANVVGDGTHTIRELIEIKNSDPRRINDADNYLTTINIDAHVIDYLQHQDISIDSIPKKDARILLRKNSNISTGGDSIDVTDIAHPSVGEISLKAIRAIPGLDFAGVDFMTKDITRMQDENSYTILEVNSTPGYAMQDLPFEGKGRNAAEEYLKILFPELEST